MREEKTQEGKCGMNSFKRSSQHNIGSICFIIALSLSFMFCIECVSAANQTISRSIKIGEFYDKTIKFHNYKDYPIDFSFELEGDAASMVDLDKMNMTIMPDNDGHLKITLFANRNKGTYRGMLKLVGDINEEIPIEIKVYHKSIPVEALLIELSAVQDKIYPGRTFK